MKKKTIVHARWLIPVDETKEKSAGRQPVEILENHTIIFDESGIEKILPSELFDKKHRQKYADKSTADIYYLNDHIVLPGLINAHTHSAMTLFRGIADDIALMPWLENHIWPLEQKWVDAGFVEAGTRLAITEMLKAGVTCFNDMYFYPDVSARVADEAGMRMVAGMPVIDFPTVWATDTDEYLRKGLQLHDHWRGSPYISTIFAPHAPYTVGDDTLKRIRAQAEELDLGIHMHVQETQAELSQSKEQYGMTPLQRLDKLGLLDNRFLAAHMVALEDDDIALAAKTKINVAHCPQANLKLASGIARITEMQNQGINVALGTDGVACNNDMDLLDEAKTAVLLAKGQSLNAEAVTASDGLKMLTINAAKALGLDSVTGSLKPGKMADMVAFDMRAANTMPLYNAVSQLIYSASSRQVSHVWVNGRLKVKQGECLVFNEPAVLQQTADWQQKIAAA